MVGLLAPPTGVESMAEPDRKPKFEVRGINHLALVVRDMAETKHFYGEVLGLPLVRALELADGGQQAFFAVTDNSILSAVWYPEAPDGEVGLINRPFGGVDETTGQHKPGPPDLKQSATGSMHHMAFTVPLAKQEEYKQRLRAHGIPCTEINHHIAYGDGKQAYHPTVLPNDAEAIDEFVNSIYFPDPDGRTFEFAAYTRPLLPDDHTHTPARPEG
jgi:catechol 2,3-dioxygenase-like lactoylglutathione lyase family enzyme